MRTITPSRPAERSDTSPPSRFLETAATSVLLTVGLTLAVYALTAFAQPDWTVAGPGLLVAAAGVVGLRLRWAYLAGLAPIGAVLTVAAPVIAFDLNRPGETPYFVASVIVVIGSCFAAVLGVAAALVPAWRHRALGALGVSAVLAAAVSLTVLSSNDASAATADGISATERAESVEVRLRDLRFEIDGGVLPSGGVIRVRNVDTLPHDLTIPSLGIAVFVPSGRDTYVRLPDEMPPVVGMICTIGDHQLRGMGLDAEVR